MKDNNNSKNKISLSTNNLNKNNNNEMMIKNKNLNFNNEDAKNSNLNHKISLKNDINNNEKLQNKNLLKNGNIKKNNSPNPLNQIIPNGKINNIINTQRNNMAFTNNYNSTINIGSTSLSRNHKMIKILSPQKDIFKTKIINNNYKNNFMQTQKNVEIDTDTGVGCNIVSFDIPRNFSLSSTKNQYYNLVGKKIHQKPSIKTEPISPLDKIYKQQFNKKIKLENLSNSNNDIPKKISPAFGRTAYAFYTKKEIEEFGGNFTNSINLKGNNNVNIINNNYNIIGNNNTPPYNIKFMSKGIK